MKDNIFSNFYTKVMSFFTQGKEVEGESARDTASNRLKLVLMQDRSNLDGATMQKMREQLISVISRYIEIDTEALDLNLEGDGEEIALMLNIPVIRARTLEEIAEIEAKEAEEKKAKTETSDEENSETDEDVKDDESETDEKETSADDVQDDSDIEENQEDNQSEDTEEAPADDDIEEEKEVKTKKSKKNKEN